MKLKSIFKIENFEKKVEKKFRKTSYGKILYKMNIASIILFIISITFMIIVMFNQGNTLSALLISMIIMAYIFILLATLMCLMYYYELRDFSHENDVNKKLDINNKKDDLNKKKVNKKG